MKSPFGWIYISLVCAIAIFVFSPTFMQAPSSLDGWGIRELCVFISGLGAFVLMVLCVIIAARPSWTDRFMGGLDNAYRIHKWTAITAACLAFVHWGLEQIPAYLVSSGVLEHPGDLSDGRVHSSIETFLFKSGTVIAEYAFYALLILTVVALFGRVPYRVFRKSHKLMSFLFLIISFHAATAPLKDAWYATVSGWLVLGLCGIGIGYALVSITGRTGKNRKHIAVIESLSVSDTGMLDLILKIEGNSLKHKAGQFAFVRFAHDDEQHPFTIASDGQAQRNLRFVVKPLGDFTDTLPGILRVGQQAEVEGPYGRFDFRDDKAHQIWVAGGIGITPFMARLEDLAVRPDQKTARKIDLCYCTRTEIESAFPDGLDKLCAASGVTLHRIIAEKGEFLCADVISEKTDEKLTEISVWACCGPEALVRSLKRDLMKNGLPKTAFHAENFSMR